MPTSFTIDRERGVIFRVFYGELTIDEIIDSYSAMLAHEDFSPGMRVLTDLRQMTPFAFRRDVLKIAEFVGKNAERIGALKIALIVRADSTYGMLRELEAELSASSVELGVFRDVGPAREWLGLEKGDTVLPESSATEVGTGLE